MLFHDGVEKRPIPEEGEKPVGKRSRQTNPPPARPGKPFGSIGRIARGKETPAS